MLQRPNEFKVQFDFRGNRVKFFEADGDDQQSLKTLLDGVALKCPEDNFTLYGPK